ncbi:HAD family hydrolase [Bradyrhizobium elkanii]|uniref:HAD family hydrolase n=1 Tax=Bradyrhizobium elkanii TaxID=29448 RepID=UPI0020A0CB3D|nr:HAD family phosphatase [Bradyrhizobium elkanii]MCP1966652.1 HAD superfamily hydrolase (TIGR01509 family) [Bradyrhizobium elkanii]MCS3522819.1 HAD superfamily hydrolase (TIGR01509 family) [Bradyrhizobium elkanii]MCS4070472.1 HAD superfamily hydrolase (TIGR01509 family) [Bradyrhizobium elkanii]MCS4077104.1 HAD superfamily hydrolase (TIGR01509 family) [Bradyrhizobium elkanii]MCS4111844.1 HAD superfamily hydrolase (TIGR01509 family) [Bradyrhizobium elkanii]
MNARWTVDAVLLDMDGTLLDTEKVYFDSLIAALNACGYTDDVVALCHSMVGLPGPACEAMLRDHYGAAFPLEAVNLAFLDHRDRMMRSGLPLKSGTLDLLDAIAAARRPMAIVTSSSRRSAERNLTLAGIRARFDTLLTLDDVAQGKPDPELYLKAAARLGVTPASCIAVEDSNHGVAAAHAAGAITLMVPDMAPPTDETRAKCAAVLPDLNAVLALLRERGAL